MPYTCNLFSFFVSRNKKKIVRFAWCDFAQMAVELCGLFIKINAAVCDFFLLWEYNKVVADYRIGKEIKTGWRVSVNEIFCGLRWERIIS